MDIGFQLSVLSSDPSNGFLLRIPLDIGCIDLLSFLSVFSSVSTNYHCEKRPSDIEHMEIDFLLYESLNDYFFDLHN